MAIQFSKGTPRADLAVPFMEYAAADSGVNLVCNQMLAPLTVYKKNAKLSVITRESMLKTANAKHANKATFSRIDMYAEDLEYDCEDYGLETQLTATDVANYSTEFDAEMAAVQHLRLKLFIEQEKRASTLLWNTSTWTGSTLYKDWSAAPWDVVGSDVISHIHYGCEKVRGATGIRPNTLLIGAKTLAALFQNTGIKNQFPGAPLITYEMVKSALASIFGISKIVVGEQIYDSALEGQTFSGTDVWNEDYAMLAVTANPGDPLNTPCVGRALYWDAISPAEGETPAVVVDEYQEPQTDSMVYRGRHFVDELVFDPYFAHLMKIDA